MESRLIFDDDLDEAARNLSKSIQDAISNNMNKECQEAANHHREEEFWAIPKNMRWIFLIALFRCLVNDEDLLKIVDSKLTEEDPELAKQIREILTKESDKNTTT